LPEPSAGRALILGGGIMGLGSAWALRRRGWTVQVLEQDSVPNPRGASVDRTRLIRYAYGARAGYMRMVDDAFAAWELLWADLGERLYCETGAIAYSADASRFVAESATALRADGRQADEVSPAEMRRRLPMLNVPESALAIAMDRGGVLLAEQIVAALGRLLAGCIERARVIEVDPARASVRTADGRVLVGDLLVLAAGPWAPRLLPALATRVRPSRQVLTYYAPPPEWREAWSRAPILLDLTHDTGVWAAPPVAGHPLKLGDHAYDYAADPETDPRLASPADLARLAALLRPHFRDFDRYRLAEARVCFYDNETEENFVIETLGPACWVMSGFSGHGFKFGPCLGLALAAAVEDPVVAKALPAWAAGRQGEGLCPHTLEEGTPPKA